jgi:hypothetical protein
MRTMGTFVLVVESLCKIFPGYGELEEFEDEEEEEGFVNGSAGEFDESHEEEGDLETGDEFDWDSNELEATLME